MKKHLITLLCVLSLMVSLLPAGKALEGEALRSADLLATLNLMDQTDYALTAPATRAQATALLVNLAGARKAAEQDVWISGFRDVPAHAATAVNYASHQNWISGATVLEFKPDQAITANAWCTMLLRMLGYSDRNGDFAVEDAAAFAQRIGLVSRSYSGLMTRGDVFETMRDALTFPYKGSTTTVIQRLIDSGTCTQAAANALGLFDKALTARQVADRHMAAVFAMKLYQDELHHDAGEISANASGFFISPDGLAVTNYHSIAGQSFATATLSTGESYPVKEVVYYDKEIDIAVIRVSRTSLDRKTTSAFAYLDVVGTKDLRPGDEVYTLGNPLGLGLAISSGIVSDKARHVERYALPCVMNTADISQGSSGGALLNVYGQVLAVTSGAYSYGNNMYLAVPADPVLTADLTAPGITLFDLDQQSTEDD